MMVGMCSCQIEESAETKQSTSVVDMRMKKADERGADKRQEGYFEDRFVCFIFFVCCLFYVGEPNEVWSSIVYNQPT